VVFMTPRIDPQAINLLPKFASHPVKTVSK